MSADEIQHKIPVSVLVVVHTKDGLFLLLERADRTDFWQSVTGSLNNLAEPPIKAAQRELFEETGFWLEERDFTDWHEKTVYDIYPHWRHRYPAGVFQNTEHTFSVCLDKMYTPRLAKDEHVAYRWLDRREAAAKCFSPSNRSAIERCLTNEIDVNGRRTILHIVSPRTNPNLDPHVE